MTAKRDLETLVSFLGGLSHEVQVLAGDILKVATQQLLKEELPQEEGSRRT